jgi:hypothetical protein
LVAYRGDGTQVQFGSFFDALVSFEVPPPGGSASGTLDVSTELSLNGGSFVPIKGSGLLLYRDNQLGYLDAEVLSMNLATAPGAQPLSIRESPTLMSLGKTKLTTVGGQMSIDSFFDIYMELSADGGTSWSPLTPQLVLTSVPEPSNWLLLGAGLVAVIGYRTRKLRRKRCC